MSKNQIVHIADVHVRFNSREEEYKTVLQRTIDDIKSIKPRRIVLAGDLFHTKINMSPTSVSIIGDFISKLSEISPTDILIGNHDTNLTSAAQGDSITPLVELLPNGYIITKFNPELPIPENGKNGIYFYKDSGFYNIDEEIIYGVYSMLDGEILQLTKKEKDKKYIALYHGAIFGAVMDNGYPATGDNLIKPSVFNNFSAVLMGDFHEFQVVQEGGQESQKPTMIYPGSLIQQNFGESIEKGYVLWNLNDFSYERRFIPNDYGYNRLNIYKGEIWEDRVQDLKFSLNKKKTKVEIILHDDQENYSVEKLSQIEKYIKNRFGCESVSADFQAIDKELQEISTDSEEVDVNNTESAEKLLLEFLQQNNYENIDDVIDLSRELDKKLNTKKSPTNGKRIEYNSMEVSNLLSFPVETTIFDFDRLTGITGIFGPNYNGKSNVMKVFCWIAYGKMPGDLENSKVVNMYTNNPKGWGKMYFTIAGIKYYAYRGATIKKKKDGTPEVNYAVEYKKQARIHNELTGEDEMKWIDVESEEAATEKKEKKKLIVDYIGTYEDFMVCAMQANGEDYLSLSQQPKNDLINKFLGLEVYREKYDLGNDIFKTIKAKQKVLGDPAELETQIVDYNTKISLENDSLAKFQEEKDENNKQIDGINNKIIEATKKLHKIEIPEEIDSNKISSKISLLKSNVEIETSILKEKELWLNNGDNYKKELSEELKSLDIGSVKEKNIDTLKFNIEKIKKNIELENSNLLIKQEWLETNLKKDISDNLKNLDKAKVENELSVEKIAFNSEKEEYVKIETWLKENVIKTITSKQDVVETKISDFRVAISGLENKVKIAKGEKCPTCNHVSHEPDPVLEKKSKEDLERGIKVLKEAQQELNKIKSDTEHNIKHENNTLKLESLKVSIQGRHKNITSLKGDLELSSQKEEIIKHNSSVDSESLLVKNIKISIESKEKEIIQLQNDIDSVEKYSKKQDIISHNTKIDLENTATNTIKASIELKEQEIKKSEEQLVILEKNKTFIIENSEINQSVKNLQEEIKVYKTMNLQVDSKIKESSGNMGAWKNNVENLTEKLNSIKETDRVYKKYSVYLQAVGRDGIPAMIIRKKMPIINHKINNLLKGMVSFKVEMFVKPNGDVKEMFYFSENKSDTLPLNMGSGSVKFITSTAISDALHYVSMMIKPSLKVIDEGFDTLDNRKLMELSGMFSYLKSKYKNIFIVTHKSEVRDFVDNIIEVQKTKEGITDPDVLANAEAGISRFVCS